MPFLLAEILNFQGSAHLKGVGSLSKITDIVAYTTYDEEKFSANSNKTNPRAFVPPLGKKARDPVKDEWEKDQLFLELGEEFKIVHKRIKMNKDEKTGVLLGNLVIS